MRIAFIILFLCLCQLCVGSSTRFWKKRVNKLEKKVKLLSKRLNKLEKAICRRPDCPKGFVAFKHYCLKFALGEKNRKDWLEARKDCKRMKAEIVTINHKSKEKFIANHLSKNSDGGEDVFIGLVATTDVSAKVPYYAQERVWPGHLKVQIALRWVSNNESITTDTYFKDNQDAPLAKWSPKEIIGDPRGPRETRYFYENTCVSIHLGSRATETSKPELIWRFVSGREQLNYICEMRLKKSPCD